VFNPHPQLVPYEQSHDAEGTINPSEKLVARGNSWELRPAHDQRWKQATPAGGPPGALTKNRRITFCSQRRKRQ
jgi:hypothetical protein